METGTALNFLSLSIATPRFISAFGDPPSKGFTTYIYSVLLLLDSSFTLCLASISRTISHLIL
ncbi:hypothetical protein BDV12DRAFT_165488 [Aspergillus spectabilis]